jgi:hypothetical protein
VVCRAVLQGHSGEGLSIASYKEDVSASEAISPSLLYTKYVKKRDEYRVHVMKDVAFFVQKKVAPYSRSERPNYQIRNHSNGFVFAVNDLSPDDSVLSESVKAVKALGLDFGAVDVIWNERRKKATVIEVNTACSVTGDSTLVRYSNALKGLLNGKDITPWDKRVPQTSNQIGSEGYIGFNVEAAYENGTMLRLARAAMFDLKRQYEANPTGSNGALSVLFEMLSPEMRERRLFTIEELYDDSDWVRISLWWDGYEHRISYRVHPSDLGRVEF